ncbi:MAG: glutamate-cysteine ligase family protein [Pseudomonadota bacterium]
MDYAQHHTKQARSLIQRLFEEAFPHRLSGPRHAGPEEEFPVVDCEGNSADITPLFNGLVDLGWNPKRDSVTGSLIGAYQHGLDVGMDVGRGTLEIGFPHVENLLDHVQKRAEVLEFVGAQLAVHNQIRLRDYGVQPKTLPTSELWAPKGRGEFFRTFFPSEVHVQTLSASSQVHIDVTHDEVIPALEMLLSLSPVLIAFNANSPVWAGCRDPYGMIAARQDFWYRFTAENGYWSNVRCGPSQYGHGGDRMERAPTSFEELAFFMSTTPFIVSVQGTVLEGPDVPFETWYTTHGVGLSDADQRDAVFNHVGTIWWDARPRAVFGTVEVRPSCQGKDAVSSHALVLGLVENLEATLAYVRLARTHQAWRALQALTLKDGMRAPGMATIAQEVIVLAEEGLRRRGFGEEVLLEPLKARVRDVYSPGHAKLELFEQGGIDALLESLLQR